MRDLIVIEIEIWIFPSNKQFFLPKADYDPVHITQNFVCFAKKPFLVRTSLPTKIFSTVTKLQLCRREYLEA